MRAIVHFVLTALLAGGLFFSTPSAIHAQATALAIGSITREYIGQSVTIRARIVDVVPGSNSLHFVLDDQTGKIQMNLPTRLYNQKRDRAGLNFDADVRITGTVIDAKTVLQLDVTDVSNIIILTPGSSDNIAVTHADLLGTRFAGVGTVVAIEGRITEIVPVRSGFTFLMADHTGTVRIRLINRVLRYAPREDQLVVGASIRVVGRVAYSRRLGPQLTPTLGYDVKLKK